MGLQASVATMDAGNSNQRNNAGTDRIAIPAKRSLVPVAIAAADDCSGHASSPRGPRNYPAAAFVTHLIATAQGAPQTRSRRRAEPDCAISAYRATSRRTLPAGRAISAAG